jgi:bifunctional non-homologous end joining protein LigD
VRRPATAQPILIAPRLAAAGDLPSGPGWAYEFKYDGVRAIVYTGDDGVQAFSRNDREITGTYPELAECARLLGGRRAVLDGEIVAFDGHRPSFARLKQRMHVVLPSAHLLAAVPVQYYVFDVLALDGRDLTDQPYAARRNILADRGGGEPDRAAGLTLSGEHVRVPANFVDVDANAVLQAAEIAGLEGVVAKRLTAPYRPGPGLTGVDQGPFCQVDESLRG